MNTRDNFRILTTYIPIDDNYTILLKRVGDNSVASYLRELIEKDLGIKFIQKKIGRKNKLQQDAITLKLKQTNQ